jgi:phosphonate transport system permease protein
MMARHSTALVFGAGFLLLLFGLWRVDAAPTRLLEGVQKLGWLLALMWPPTPGGALWDLLGALAETVAMAFLGTLLAVMVALPLCVLGAGNIVANVLARFTIRRAYDGLRAVDSLVWALIFVSAVGMGPFAGILALALPDIGLLAKMFSEALEAAERQQVEGVRAAGGSRLHAIRYGLLPQAGPVMLAQVLYTFESNTRSATILGVVGAGGIGLSLSDRIRLNNWDEAAFIVLMILVAVGIIDWGSRRLRLRLIRA